MLYLSPPSVCARVMATTRILQVISIENYIAMVFLNNNMQFPLLSSYAEMFSFNFNVYNLRSKQIHIKARKIVISINFFPFTPVFQKRAFHSIWKDHCD